MGSGIFSTRIGDFLAVGNMKSSPSLVGLSSALMAAILAFELQYCFAQRTDPDGRVRIICMGDVIDQYGGYNSFTVIRFDPAIRATLVPSRHDYVGGYDIAWRNMRIYFPRTRERLVGEYDQILMSDADQMVFRPEWISWMSGSVEGDGLGLIYLGSIVHYGSAVIVWEGTTLAEVMPARQAPGDQWLSQPFWVKILNRGEALMQSLPWEDSPPLANLNLQVPKEGSLRWANAVGAGGEYPLMTFWKMGNGAVLNFASKFPAGVEPWARDWDLFPQAMSYMVYRVAGKPLPDDPLLFRGVLNGFMEFNEMNSLLDSMLDWVEKFGGNPRKLRDRLLSVWEFKIEAERAYLNGDFQRAMTILGDGKAEQYKMRDSVVKAKDEALFWVYLTEWFSLMGTLMISSYILWALMVRRRLYHKVGISRMRTKEHD